jgi:hypothetical protein
MFESVFFKEARANWFWLLVGAALASVIMFCAVVASWIASKGTPDGVGRYSVTAASFSNSRVIMIIRCDTQTGAVTYAFQPGTVPTGESRWKTLE